MIKSDIELLKDRIVIRKNYLLDEKGRIEVALDDIELTLILMDEERYLELERMLDYRTNDENMMKRIIENETKNEWKKITESKPRHRDMIIYFDGCLVGAVGRYSSYDNHMPSATYLKWENVKYWMLLPKLPQD